MKLAGDNPTRKRPSGGSGGAGGNVYAIADSNLETLDSQLHHFNGQPGGPGGGKGTLGPWNEGGNDFSFYDNKDYPPLFLSSLSQKTWLQF